VKQFGDEGANNSTMQDHTDFLISVQKNMGGRKEQTDHKEERRK
jgi:hypothetical protein